MGVKVTITWDGLEQVISNLSDIGENAPKNLERQVVELAKDTKQAWRENTPRGKTGRLQDEEEVEPDGLSFTLNSTTKYYKFVDEGHQTPKGWNTRHGYRPAKKRSHVAAREITSKTVEFIEENIEEYLSKFLE